MSDRELHQRVDGLEVRVSVLERKVGKVDSGSEIEGIRKDIVEIKANLQSHDERLKKLEGLYSCFSVVNLLIC
ncbi:hypothetical protein K469DRAFT_699546 [Zopfia rhizophila CBS 207.26]|uniref:Uncharacterized protein n=1 Tax=Zopfia rhizophila CBS 207.26 TaxID=1314779 RepID=A0A6A6EWI6_9PEZI|nr:hypothetical protein K469DRAFT_717988 [Zopfia rhizophila CBS 207.26]KAF2195924.1 hypothetical protein K469DRAFT_699546 [Zopfia rhizophila CBS 207.26]